MTRVPIYASHAQEWTYLDTLAFLIVLIAVLATFGTIYVWRVYLSDHRRPRSWLLLMLAVACTAIDFSAAWFGYLSIRRLMHLEQLEWALPINAGLIVAIELVPAYIALVFFWQRRRRHKIDEITLDNNPQEPHERTDQ